MNSRSKRQRPNLLTDGIVQLSLDLSSASASMVENEESENVSTEPMLWSGVEPLRPKTSLILPRTSQDSCKTAKTALEGIQKSWVEEFYSVIPWESRLALFDPLLGHLKVSKPKTNNWSRNYPLQIHRLEKDLVYLIAIAIAKSSQLYLSLPVSPCSLGILTIAYYAHLSRSERSFFNGNYAFSPKHFAIWIRPRDNGQILNLKISPTSADFLSLSSRIACIPLSKLHESIHDNRLKIVMVRSLEEGIELFQQSEYCSLTILDDDLGRTSPLPSQYGHEVFKLANFCHKKNIPMIGLIPPWSMGSLEWYENKYQIGLGLWAIDSPALFSYPLETHLFNPSTTLSHPIEESFRAIHKRQDCLCDPQTTITMFSFSTNDEEKIAQNFKEASDLLIALGNRSELRAVWSNGWKIWRDLSAPILPFHLLWEKFLEGTLTSLKAAADRCNEPKALDLYWLLQSLSTRFQNLSRNPFIEWLEKLGSESTIAITDASRLDALKDFLLAQYSASSQPQVFSIGDLKGLVGNHLVVVGQPKACDRSFLQTCFFKKVDVLLWSVLASRAEHWWSGLEIDPRAWHNRTWRTLTQKEVFGRYGYSYQPKPVQIKHEGTIKLNRLVDVSKLEESFSQLSQSSLDSGLSRSVSSNGLDRYYCVTFVNNFQIRVSVNSEFLVLIKKHAYIVSVKELTSGTKVVLFEGMNRDELFAQKAGLLEETRANWHYRTLLEAWRELVKQRVEKFNYQSISNKIFYETGSEISQTAIQAWLNGNDLLTLPRLKEHFLWFIPTIAHAGFEQFWNTVNDLRKARRQLGRVISECAQEGWRDRNSDDIVFQYQQIFITVGELRDAMQVLRVLDTPQLILHPPDYPINRLFRNGGL